VNLEGCRSNCRRNFIVRINFSYSMLNFLGWRRREGYQILTVDIGEWKNFGIIDCDGLSLCS
jgi:hypothetical protein